jgi:hypothetical protein
VRFLLVPMVAVLALGLVGCSEETPGDATAGDATGRPTIPTEGGDTGTDEPTETSEAGGSGTADLQPCDLLTSAEQATFNLGAGAEDELGPARTCQWQASGEHTITIGVIDDLGLDDVQSSGATQPMKVGSHDAVQYTAGVSACAIAIAVTDTSRVDVSGVAGGDTTKACAVAKQAAQVVEPKLP